jgi:predicted AAA+ superfamily ATPase
MGKWVARPELESRLHSALKRAPIVTLLGPRQCGKTTLAKRVVKSVRSHYFDLENPVDEARLAEPITALERLDGIVVIDEVQRVPSLFPPLRVLADRARPAARFLLLGSASPELVRASSESLAGRVAFVDMSGFELREVGAPAQRRLWLRGGFPRSFLARNEVESAAWRRDFIRTFLERDLRTFGVDIPSRALRRLWTMLAHYHGQVWNASEIGRSLGEPHTTVRRHADVLVDSLVVRELRPWFENVGKREVKSSKLYVRDSGILHSLLGTESFDALESHPKLGASWEGFVIEQILSVTGIRDAYFWGTLAGAELDLLLNADGRRVGVEVKYADAPRMTRSIRIALDDLKLSKLYVVHPGTARYALDAKAEAIGLADLLAEFPAPHSRRRTRLKNSD